MLKSVNVHMSNLYLYTVLRDHWTNFPVMKADLHAQDLLILHELLQSNNMSGLEQLFLLKESILAHVLHDTEESIRLGRHIRYFPYLRHIFVSIKSLIDCRAMTESHMDILYDLLEASVAKGITDIFEIFKEIFEPDDIPKSAQAKRMGTTLTMAAASCGHTGILREIHAIGLEVDHVRHADSSGSTALHMAVAESHNDTVEYLLDQGAGIEDKDASGYSPLLTSCWMGNEEALKLMASPTVLTEEFIETHTAADGLNPYLAACYGGLTTVVDEWATGTSLKILRSRDCDGNNALHLSLSQGHLDIMEILVSKHRVFCAQDMITSRNDLDQSPIDLLIKAGFGQAHLDKIFKAHALPCLLLSPAYYTATQAHIDELCAFCRDHIVINDALVHFPCKHLFHQVCFEEWDNPGQVCPLCKQSIYKLLEK